MSRDSVLDSMQFSRSATDSVLDGIHFARDSRDRVFNGIEVVCVTPCVRCARGVRFARCRFDRMHLACVARDILPVRTSFSSRTGDPVAIY